MLAPLTGPQVRVEDIVVETLAVMHIVIDIVNDRCHHWPRIYRCCSRLVDARSRKGALQNRMSRALGVALALEQHTCKADVDSMQEGGLLDRHACRNVNGSKLALIEMTLASQVYNVLERRVLQNS